MYQSMFVLGILIFGALSVSFTNYADYADDVALESNLTTVVRSVGNDIINVIERGRAQQSTTGSITITVDLILESQFGSDGYSLSFNVNSMGIAVLSATAVNKIYANYTLGYIDGVAAGEIDFSGTIQSSNGNPQIVYTWTDTPTETLTLQ